MDLIRSSFLIFSSFLSDCEVFVREVSPEKEESVLLLIVFFTILLFSYHRMPVISFTLRSGVFSARVSFNRSISTGLER